MKDLVRLELIRESLIAVVNEMRANIIHSSYSSVLYEGHDFSCGLMTADGRQISQSLEDHPIHIFAVPYSTREVAEAFAGDIHEGDIFLHNDPYTGGTHLNDILMLYPVFRDAELAMFAAVRCHWGDVGGMTPGSLSGQVTEVIQEGIRITPTRICHRGEMNEAFLQLMFDNMRTRAERMGDFNTMLGTTRKAAEHVERLFKRFGSRELLDGVEELIRRAETQMRASIRALPDGVYYGEGYIESTGPTAEQLIAKLKLTIDGDEIIADFSGSSPQTAGPTNIGPSMALNSLGTIVKSFLDPYTPINHGSFAPCTVIAPEGSFMNARYPAPCGAMAEVKHLLDAVTAGALGQAAPHMKIGRSQGRRQPHLHFRARAERRRHLPALRVAGGGHRRHGRCRRQSRHALLHGGRLQLAAFLGGRRKSFSVAYRAQRAAQRLVWRWPLSGWARHAAGGSADRRRSRALRRFGEERDSALWHRRRYQWGRQSFHGHSRRRGARAFARAGKRSRASSCAPAMSCVKSRRVAVATAIPWNANPSGWPGTYGSVTSPLSKPNSAMASCSPATATSTKQRRAGQRDELRAARVHITLGAANDDVFDGPRRRFLLSPQIAERLDVRENDLVELCTGDGPGVRGWAGIDRGVREDTLMLGPAGMRLLSAAPGDRVEIRATRPAPAI